MAHKRARHTCRIETKGARQCAPTDIRSPDRLHGTVRGRDGPRGADQWSKSDQDTANVLRRHSQLVGDREVHQVRLGGRVERRESRDPHENVRPIVQTGRGLDIALHPDQNLHQRLVGQVRLQRLGEQIVNGHRVTHLPTASGLRPHHHAHSGRSRNPPATDDARRSLR